MVEGDHGHPVVDVEPDRSVGHGHRWFGPRRSERGGWFAGGQV
jgi:hypothetical protein